MNVVQEIERIKASEAQHGIFGGISKASWHEKYRLSAWVYLGGLSYELSEGDVICFMSQWGEIEDINLIRDTDTGKSLGFCFVKYEDQRSTVLAVDNFNGIMLLDRTLRCDHVDRYKLPKEIRQREETALEEDPSKDISIGPGHAYIGKELENDLTIDKGVNLWQKPVSSNTLKPSIVHNTDIDRIEIIPRMKKVKKSKKEEKKLHKQDKDKRERNKDVDKGNDRTDRYKSEVAGIHRSIEANIPAVSNPKAIAMSSDIPLGSLTEASSWRGRYDPAGAVSRPHSSGLKRSQPDSTGHNLQAPPVKKSFFESASSSFGGMARRR